MALWLRRQAQPPKRHHDEQVGIYVDETGALLKVTNGQPPEPVSGGEAGSQGPHGCSY